MAEVYRGQPPGRRRQGGRSRGRESRPGFRAERHQQGRPQAVDRLVGEGPQIASHFLQRVQDLDAGYRVATDQGAQERFDRLRVDQPQDVAHAIGRQIARVGAEQLIEHRLRVPHAAGRETGDEIDCLRLGRPPVRLEDGAQLAADLRDREAPEIEALDTRNDGRPDLRAVGRAEDEDHVVGRLLERLEQDVPTLLDPLDLIDDEDLDGQVRGARVDPRQELAHVVDPVVRGRVHLAHIESAAFADGDAGRALVARFAVAQVRAVEGLGQDPRHRGLAGSAGPDEEIGVGAPARPDGVSEGLDNRLLADDLAEGLSPPAAVDGLVRCGRTHEAPAGVGETRGGAAGSSRRPRAGAPCTLCRSAVPVPTSGGGSDQAIPRHPTIIA